MSEKKIKILLLSVSSTSFFYEQLVIPFGLVSLAAYIDDGSYDIKGVEMNYPPEKIPQRYLAVDNELLNEVVAFSPDILVMSTYASNIYNALFWSKMIKEKLPKCLSILGGNHASYIAKECFEYDAKIDIVVRFEGEIAFKKICEKIKNNNNDFSNIPNIIYRKGFEIVENSQTEFIRDISTLPTINGEKYFNPTAKKPEDIEHADLISARGCPFNCTFCNCNHYWGKKYRTRSIASVIAELKLLTSTYPNLKSIRFRDESLTIDKKRCLELCSEIKKNELKFEFQAHSRLDGLDEEVIKALTEAGFKLVFIGIESGSKKVLKNIKKEINIDRTVEIVKLLRNYSIAFRLSFLSATRSENIFDTLKTIRLIKKLRLTEDEYYFGFGLYIYPGTKECEDFIKLHPDYRWLATKYRFKGKYTAVKDPAGNILYPVYREYGIFQIAFILFLLKPKYFIKAASIKIKNLLQKFKFTKTLKN